MARVELNIVALGDFKSVNTQIAALKTQVDSLNKSIAGVGLGSSLVKDLSNAQSAFKATMLSTGQFTEQTVKLKTETEKFGQALVSGKLKLTDYFAIIKGKSAEAQAQMRALAIEQTKLQNSIVQADPTKQGVFSVYTPTKINEVTKATQIASNMQNLYNIAVEKGSQSLINWGKNTQWAGRQLTVGLTVPMTLFGNAAMKTFQDVNEQLVRLQKVYGTGLTAPTQAALDQIRSQVTGLSRELAASMGIAAKDTATMAADLAATGLQGQDLLNATREAMRLAKLGEMDTQSAMQATISLQNVYKLSTQDLSNAVNFLNAVENQTSTSLQDLAAGIPKVGPIVQQLGGSFKDTAVMMVAMKEAGIPAAQSANAIKSALASLINPTKAAKDAFAAYNINIADVATKTGGNPVLMIQTLQKAMEGLAPLAKAQLIEKLFGKFQEARISALIANLGQVGSQTKTAFDLMNSSNAELSGVAANEMKIATESVTGKFKRAVETIKADLIPLGEKIMSFATVLLKFGDGVSKAFSSIPGPVKLVLGILAAGVAIAGPVIMLTGVFANLIGNVLRGVFAFKSLITGAKTFGELFTPESIAAEQAAKLFSSEIVNDVSAVNLLDTAVKDLTITLHGMVAAMNQAATSSFAEKVAAATSIATTAAEMGVPAALRTIPFKAPKMAAGGIIPGSGNSDSYPAMLMPGEAVIPKSAAQGNPGLVNALISGNIPHYAKGLPVNGEPTWVNPGRYSAPTDSPFAGAAEKILAFTKDLDRGQKILDGIIEQYGLTKKALVDQLRGTDVAHIKKEMQGLDKSWREGNLTASFSPENKILEYGSRGGYIGKKFGESADLAGAALPNAIKSKYTQAEIAQATSSVKLGQQPITELESAIFHETLQDMKAKVASGAIRKTSTTTRWLDAAVAITKERQPGGSLTPAAGLTLSANRKAFASGASLEEAALKGAKKRGKINSPSEEFAQVAKDNTDGLIKGAKNSESKLIQANEEQQTKLAKKQVSIGKRALGSSALMGLSMAENALPAGGIKDAVQSATNMSSMGSMFGLWGAAAGAALGLVTSGIGQLIAAEKEHKAQAESVFKVSTDELSKYKDTIDNATLSIVALNNAAGNVKAPKSASVEAAEDEKKRLDALKDGSTEKEFYKKLQGMTKGSDVAYAVKQKASALVGQGADPAKVAADMQTLISASGQGQYSGLVAKTLQEHVGTQGAGVTNFLTQQAHNPRIMGAIKMGGAMPAYQAGPNGQYDTTYTTRAQTFEASQKEFASNVYQGGSGGGLENTAKTLLSTGTNLKKVKDITDALTKSQFNNAGGTKMLAQAMIDTKGPMKAIGVDMMKISNLPMAQALKVMRAASVSETNAARQEAEKAFEAAKKAGDKTKTFLEFLAKPENQKYLDKLSNVFEKPINTIIPNVNGGLDGLSPGPTALDKSYDKLIKQENLYISSLEKRLKVQQDSNAESKRQQDYAISMTDMQNQIKQATATGDFLKANLLRQEALGKTDQYNQDTVTFKNQQILDAARTKLAELESGKADKTKITKAMTKLATDKGFTNVVPKNFDVPGAAAYGSTAQFGTIDNSSSNVVININGSNLDQKQLTDSVLKALAASNAKNGRVTQVGG